MVMGIVIIAYKMEINAIVEYEYEWVKSGPDCNNKKIDKFICVYKDNDNIYKHHA